MVVLAGLHHSLRNVQFSVQLCKKVNATKQTLVDIFTNFTTELFHTLLTSRSIWAWALRRDQFLFSSKMQFWPYSHEQNHLSYQKTSPTQALRVIVHMLLIPSIKGSVERSRHEQHFCSLLPYFLLSWLQIFQFYLSFWTSSFHLVLLKNSFRKKKSIRKTTQNALAPSIFINLSIALKLGAPLPHTQTQNILLQKFQFRSRSWDMNEKPPKTLFYPTRSALIRHNFFRGSKLKNL